MSRPKKWRKVCCLPESTWFGPLNAPQEPKHFVNMTVEEYETIRLIDLERFTQEECARQMNIARTTVQGIYTQARKKLADSMVNGRILKIEGGITNSAMAIRNSAIESGAGGGNVPVAKV